MENLKEKLKTVIIATGDVGFILYTRGSTSLNKDLVIPDLVLHLTTAKEIGEAINRKYPRYNVIINPISGAEGNLNEIEYSDGSKVFVSITDEQKKHTNIKIFYNKKENLFGIFSYHNDISHQEKNEIFEIFCTNIKKYYRNMGGMVFIEPNIQESIDCLF